MLREKLINLMAEKDISKLEIAINRKVEKSLRKAIEASFPSSSELTKNTFNEFI